MVLICILVFSFVEIIVDNQGKGTITLCIIIQSPPLVSMWGPPGFGMLHAGSNVYVLMCLWESVWVCLRLGCLYSVLMDSVCVQMHLACRCVSVCMHAFMFVCFHLCVCLFATCVCKGWQSSSERDPMGRHLPDKPKQVHPHQDRVSEMGEPCGAYHHATIPVWLSR